MNGDRIFSTAAIAVVIAGLVLAFLFIGTPGHSRLIALDERRVQDLQSIASDLHDRYGGASLPPRLPQVVERDDPSTGRPYAFRRLNANNYALCAVFAAPSPPEDTSTAEFYSASYNRIWPHSTGRTCYKLDVRRPTIEPQALH